MKLKQIISLTFLFTALFFSSCAEFKKEDPTKEKEALVVFLVRHAEKVDDSRESALSEKGQIRAEELVNVLRNAEIEHLHSSDFVRTITTAEPFSKEFGLEIELYDHKDLPALVEKLKNTGGRHLIVGHSSTTPAMVDLLGGKSGKEIDEPREYDRLYIVTIGSENSVSTVLLRYGEAYASL